MGSCSAPARKPSPHRQRRPARRRPSPFEAVPASSSSGRTIRQGRQRAAQRETIKCAENSFISPNRTELSSDNPGITSPHFSQCQLICDGHWWIGAKATRSRGAEGAGGELVLVSRWPC